MKYLCKILGLLIFTGSAFAASHSPAGDWLGFYEDTTIPGAKVHVNVDEKGILSAYYVEIYPKAGEKIPTTCSDCSGKFKNKPLKNFPMLWNLKPQKGKWVNGKGYSLERRRNFAATAWLSEDGNTLFVRGKVGLFSKVQKLKRLT
jgi:uncharacterized protein (DUF2147 family)